MDQIALTASRRTGRTLHGRPARARSDFPHAREPRSRGRSAARLPARVPGRAMAAPAQARTVNHPPTGAITLAPEAPKTGDVITFAATPADRDGDAVTVSWDVDDDGRWESSG